ncbi:ATP-binding protein [Amycolatopsis eburnea]|uniref:XRE family transcriptional regulator n=1 Tax=Amycolatopsis eburnea TaxID=2267691 RepID=A0A3R9ENB4_9PSEU|nr:helix-turn-helix domain-containing protein [Amycolatopsis eburnea]RSD13935.1 XRE family transcriptional regulator [Amycolatopsis eburnea]
MSERATFGAELRRLRHAAGLSLTELADRVHYSKGYLSKVETGLTTPNAALAALCEAELGAPGALTALLPREPARRRTRPDVRPSGLPPATAGFTGRAAELQAVRDALEAEAGVCVVSGMGGVGKTALAVRCAHRLEAAFADGCLFVDLHGHADAPVPAAAVHDRLLRVLGVPAERIPADPDDRAALYRSRLRGRSLLLVLDNAGSAAQVRPLLPAEPKCRVLVTARSRLSALDDARHVSLDVLPADAAAELVSALTGAGEADAARVADRCGRLPLAIRIAAARLRAHPAWDLAELDRRLADEAGRLGELDDGERSLSAAFRLSARQLGTAEARLFGLLALHPGSDLDVRAASALGGLPPRETDRLLDRLHDAYLVTQPATDRYGFHDLLRVFAAGTPLAEGERERAFGRLAAFAVREAERADRELAPQRYRPEIAYPDGLPEPAPLDGVAWFRAEWPNLVALCRRAGELGEHERCWQLAFCLRGYFFLAKLWDPWIATHRWARAAAEAAGDRWALATTTANLGVALVDRGDLDGASECYREALREYRAIGDRHGEATALAHDAWAAHYRGEHAAALRGFRTALEFYEQAGNDRNAAITNRGIALVLVALGEAAEAAELAAGTLAVFDALDLDLDAAMALNCLGWARFHTGEHDLAAAAYREAAARAEACDSEHEAARAYTGLGNVAAARGAREEAAGFWAQAEEIHPDLDPVVVGEARVRPA